MGAAAFLRRHFWALLGAASLLAVALRLLAGWGLAQSPTATMPPSVTDMATYRDLALQIRQGDWPAYFDYQPFYYTVFLPLAYLFSPTGGIWPVIILQALLGGATVWLTGLCGTRLFGRRAGLAAAVLLALCRFHIFYASFPLLEVWFSFWAIVVLWMTLRLCTADAPRWWTPLLLGVCCAGALLTRGSALLWLPGLAALVFWHHRRLGARRLLLLVLFFLIGFMTPILPYSIHNSRHFGRLCGPSVAGGKVMVLGNSPEAPAGGLEYPRTYHLWCAQAESGERSVLSNILHWAWREPGAFLELEARKLLLFWDKTEIPNNIAYEREGAYSRLLPWMLPWSVLGTLGAAGLLLLLKRHRLHHAALIWMAVIYWLATSAFYLLARFRVGFLPLLCLLAAYALQAAWRVRGLPARRAGVALAFCIAILLVLFAYGTYGSLAAAPLYNYLRPNGLALSFQDEAVVYDHGPFSTSDAATLDTSLPFVCLTKDFVFPPEEILPRSEEPIPQQLWLRVPPGTAAEGQTCPLVLCVNGELVIDQSIFQRHLQADWLVINFTAPCLPNDRQQVGFAVTFNEGVVPPVLIDRQRDYGRTMVVLKTKSGSPGGEAVAEWVIPKR